MQNTNDNDSGHESTCTNNPWIICIFLITFFVKKIIWRWEFQRRFRVRHGRIACCWKGIPMGTMEFLLWHHCFLCTQNNIFRFFTIPDLFLQSQLYSVYFSSTEKSGSDRKLTSFWFWRFEVLRKFHKEHTESMQDPQNQDLGQPSIETNKPRDFRIFFDGFRFLFYQLSLYERFFHRRHPANLWIIYANEASTTLLDSFTSLSFPLIAYSFEGRRKRHKHVTFVMRRNYDSWRQGNPNSSKTKTLCMM